MEADGVEDEDAWVRRIEAIVTAMSLDAAAAPAALILVSMSSGGAEGPALELEAGGGEVAAGAFNLASS